MHGPLAKMKKNLKQSEEDLERNFSAANNADLLYHYANASPSRSTQAPVTSPRLSDSSPKLKDSSSSHESVKQEGSPYFIHQLPGRRISKMVLYETATVNYI